MDTLFALMLATLATLNVFGGDANYFGCGHSRVNRAQLLSNHFGQMMLISGGNGCCDRVFGIYLSYYFDLWSQRGTALNPGFRLRVALDLSTPTQTPSAVPSQHFD